MMTKSEMSVYELSRDELIELKVRYLDNYLWETEHRSASYGEIADADEIVPDETVFEAYEGYTFVEDDFFCNYLPF